MTLTCRSSKYKKYENIFGISSVMVFSQFYFRAISLIPDLACMHVPGLYSHGVFSQSLTFLDQIQTYFRGSGLNFIFNFY